MKTHCTALLLSFIFLFSCAPKEEWQSLFNGTDLTGFHQLNGKAPYRAENNMLIGTSVMGQPNSFLATVDDYGDFILEFEVLCDTSLNSGVQFRSLSLPEYKEGRVHGYQCEIDPSNRAWSGGIYDEGRRGWLVKLEDNPAGRAAYKKLDWNHYRIEAIGNNMRIWLNGVSTANLYDDMTLSGFIAFQVHSIRNQEKEGKDIRWRNIRILTKNPENFLKEGQLCPATNLLSE